MLETRDFSRERFIIKCWFHISKEEQLARFKAREENPFKKWKLTDEDWRNRKKWDQYVEAVEEMFAKTDKKYAPWHIIASNDKKYARIETLKIIIQTIEGHLKRNQISLPNYNNNKY